MIFSMLHFSVQHITELSLEPNCFVTCSPNPKLGLELGSAARYSTVYKDMCSMFHVGVQLLYESDSENSSMQKKKQEIDTTWTLRSDITQIK